MKNDLSIFFLRKYLIYISQVDIEPYVRSVPLRNDKCFSHFKEKSLN